MWERALHTSCHAGIDGDSSKDEMRKTQDESLESLLTTRRAKLVFGDQATKDESVESLLTTRRAKLVFGDGGTTNP